MAVELIDNSTSPGTAVRLVGPVGVNDSVIQVNRPASVALQAPGGQFRIIVINQITDQQEIMLVTNNAWTANWTVERGMEGTTPVSFPDGSVVKHIVTAGALKQLIGSNLTAVIGGSPAAYNLGTDSYYNMAIGSAFSSIAPGSSSAKQNTAIGAYALAGVTTGDESTAIGFNALAQATTARQNTAVGSDAAYSVTTAEGVNAFGRQSCFSTTTADENCGFGNWTLLNATTGDHNTAMGSNAGTGVGTGTVTGKQNTFVGFNAAPDSGSDPNFATALGAHATVSADGAVAIGCDHNGNGAIATSQDSFVLGTAAHTVRIPGALTVGGDVTLTVAGGVDTLQTSGNQLIIGAEGTEALHFYSGAVVVQTQLQINSTIKNDLATNEATTATAGTANLPANPVGFLVFLDHNGTTRKIPYYAN